jgi:hypothetical protein
VTLEQLHEREGEHADGEVETVGGELTARKMIQSIVMFEFADHFLELTTLVVEVHDRLGIFLLVGDIRGDDPVMVVALEEVILVATFGTFCYEAKGIRATLHGVNGLGNLIVGFGAIIKIPLCPSMVRDSGESVHHRRVVPARRPVRRSIPAKANVRRFACLREADASLPPRASLQRDGSAKAGHAGVISRDRKAATVGEAIIDHKVIGGCRIAADGGEGAREIVVARVDKGDKLVVGGRRAVLEARAGKQSSLDAARQGEA